MLSVAAPSIAQAQMDNAVGVIFELAPDSAVEGDSDLENPPELGYRNVRANVIVPVGLESWDAVLLPGAAYRLYRPQLDGQIPLEGPESLHDLSLRLGVLKRFDETWSLLVNASVGVATDFQDLETDHLRYQGLTVVRYKRSDAWTFGVGGAVNYQFGEPRVLPAAQVIYKGDRWNAEVTVPRVASIRYTVLQGFDIGFLGQVDGNRFSIGEDLPLESVSLSIADVGLIAGVKLVGPVWLTAYSGATLFRRYDILDDDNNDLLNLDQEPGPIFRVGVVLRPDSEGVRATEN
ncbi:MAG: DUF6268 family outer membrane beta-barrel protein [Myxococcota bacterium]